MKPCAFLLAAGLVVFTLGSVPPAPAAQPATPHQEITTATSRPSMAGPATFFTGTVRIDPLFAPRHPEAPFGGAYVTFEPGARSHWHTHPLGQHLIIISGTGLTGTADGTVRELKTGDVLWCPKGVKHWHGAGPTQAMTHLALTGTLPDGANVEWMEPVTNEQYRKRP